MNKLLFFAVSLAIAASAFAQDVVISQVYGGAGCGTAGCSTYQNDYVELFNRGAAPVNLNGWSVQYASATGTNWQVTPIGNLTIQPGRYLLIREGPGPNGSSPIPPADVLGSINMSATGAKVALSSGTAALSGACPTAGVVDLVGYGTTPNCFEGAGRTPAPSTSTAAFRAGGGCADTNNNNTDFTAETASPRNSASDANACLSIGPVTLAEGTAANTIFQFPVTLNVAVAAPVTFSASTADGTAVAGIDYDALNAASFAIPAGQTGGTVAVTVRGDAAVEPDETFTVSIGNVAGAAPAVAAATGTIVNDDAASVTLTLTPVTLPDVSEGAAYSQVLTVNNGMNCSFTTSGNVPPGLALNFTGTANTATLAGVPSLSGTFSFTVSAACANGSTSQGYTVNVAFACETGVKTSTPISTVQGAGATSPMAGQTVEVEGIVVGDFQSATAGLSGFYLQEPNASHDNDPNTSEGIFIFDRGQGADVNVGDRVRVRGAVVEFSSSGSRLTELSNVQKLVCGTGHPFAVTTVTLPAPSIADWERLEGMAVQFTQPLVIAGNYDLGAFGQVSLAPQVLYQPTQSADRAGWDAQINLNARSVIVLDDASNLANANLFPTLFPQGGLTASNTLRVGALVNYDPATQQTLPLTGVLDERFGAYRIQPTAPVTFTEANPRPANPAVPGRLRAASANVLNFFTTLGKRGAATAKEFEKQRAKIVAALLGMNADVYGLSEIQNYSDGNTDNASNSLTNDALAALVDALNAASTPGAFAYIDTLALGAQNGTDAIRNAIVYKPGSVTPIGTPALFYQNDTNRPSLAQTFQPASGVHADKQTFTVVVNHFRSRATGCGAGDDPVQGGCNSLRTSMAQAVTNWLAGNPTADPAGANRRVLLIGDFNAYYGEDPIQWFETNGYRNLTNAIGGSRAYSYNFGSQLGFLDHAIANQAMNSVVSSLVEWHINADEPPALQALDSNLKSAAAQAAYFAANPYAAADHDPFVVGFNPMCGDLNDDAQVNAADQAIIRNALGKPIGTVDRRADFDGDARVTANDYLQWSRCYAQFR